MDWTRRLPRSRTISSRCPDENMNGMGFRDLRGDGTTGISSVERRKFHEHFLTVDKHYGISPVEGALSK